MEALAPGHTLLTVTVETDQYNISATVTLAAYSPLKVNECMELIGNFNRIIRHTVFTIGSIMNISGPSGNAFNRENGSLWRSPV